MGRGTDGMGGPVGGGGGGSSGELVRDLVGRALFHCSMFHVPK